MPVENSPLALLPAESAECLVYASVDAQTLAVLDAHSDREGMPRSWIIGQILRQWTEQRQGYYLAMEQGPRCAAA